MNGLRRHWVGSDATVIITKGMALASASFWTVPHRPVGDAGLAVLEDTGKTQVGYKLARAYWGRGFATEAATALATFGFTQLELPRIVALIHPANVPSTRVADKMGFRYCRTDSRRGFEQLVYELWRKESTNVGQDGSGI